MSRGGVFDNSIAADRKRLRVKVCGITTKSEIAACAAVGVDALGFMVRSTGGGQTRALSERLDVAVAKALIAAVPRSLTSVLLIHTLAIDEVRSLCEMLAPKVLQVQIPLTVQDFEILRREFPELRLIKTAHLTKSETLAGIIREVEPYVEAQCIDALLIDTKIGARTGGTGMTHDWSITASIVRHFSETAIILAGGLTPANVANGVSHVRPYAVDVSSGVRNIAWLKDVARVAAFVTAARGASSVT